MPLLRSGLSAMPGNRFLLEKLLSRVTVVDLAYGNSTLIGHIAALRQRKSLKLPDAIVAATAALYEAIVLTNDAQMIKQSAIDAACLARSFET